MRILVVEDDGDIRQGIAQGLVAAGFAVDEAGDVRGAEFQIDINTYDCLVLDRMLPDGDALDLLTERRRAGVVTPALFLTARDAISDRVQGFQAGGDDYVVKPFALEELVARVSSLCRRAQYARPPVITVGDIEIDTARCAVRRDGILLTLTLKEYRILELLAANVGQVVSRADLVEHCWDEMSEPMSNVVDVHMRQLRVKLGEPQVIETVRGVGYLLEAVSAASAASAGASVGSLPPPPPPSS
jgi:DNA-binding response OmpR family regulator